MPQHIREEPADGGRASRAGSGWTDDIKGDDETWNIYPVTTGGKHRQRMIVSDPAIPADVLYTQDQESKITLEKFGAMIASEITDSVRLCRKKEETEQEIIWRKNTVTLYEINDEILNCVDEETGEIIDPEKLSRLQMESDDKVEGIALWIKNLLSEAAAIKTEKDKLGERQKACENKAKNLKEYLSGFLAGQKFKTPRVAISYRKSESVNVSDIGKIPEEYLKRKDPEPDKTAIKAAIKSGQIIDGAEIVVNQNIQIK